MIIRAILREEMRKPEEMTAAVIEAETKAIRKITLKEIEEVWKTAFMKKEK